MKISDKAEEILLAAAIDSLNTPQFPDVLCDWLHKRVGFDNITILAYFQDHGPELKMFKGHQSGIYESIQNIYLAGVYLLDPFHDLHINSAAAGVYRLSDIAPDKFRSNRYYREYYKRTGMEDEFAFVTHPAAGVSLHICLGRDSHSNTRFTPRDLATAKRIMPLVASLSALNWSNLISKGEYTEGNITSKLIKAMRHRHDIMLSPRQAEVAMLVLRGHSSVSIGIRLGLSDQTIKVFRKQLYKKCKISSQAQLFTLMIPLLELVSAS